MHPIARILGITMPRKKAVRYLSLCSGIEAATTAWHSLGWEPVAFCEIDAFPSAVLAYHWPHVPNLKDMTKWRTWSDDMLAQVDILVGGTPCQSWSVAGKQLGKADPRGMLTFCFLEIIECIQPKWVVWENVPGILSDKGGAFVEFLDEILRLGYYLNCDILDAQFFLLAQRRRRIFLACQRADILMSQKTNTSATIGAIMFAGILHDILDAHSMALGKGRGSSDAKCANVADGLQRKTKPFAAHGEELLSQWLTNCADAWLSAATEPRFSESKAGDGTSTAGSSKAEEVTWSLASYLENRGLNAGGPSLNTSASLKQCLAELFKKANASTTSTGLKTTTDLPISSYVDLLLIIENFTRHSATSCPHSLKAESLVLTAIKKAITYARQTNREVLPDTPLHGFWTDFARQAERHSKPFASAGDGFRPEQVLFESEGVRRDTPPSRGAGQETARDAGAGIEECGKTLLAKGNCSMAADLEDYIPQVAGALDTECGGGKLTHQSIANGHIIGTLTARMLNSLGARDVEEGALLPVLVPTACAFGGDVARTLSARHDSSPCADRGMDVVAVAFQSSQSGVRVGDVHATLDGNNGSRRHNGVIAPVAFAQNQLGEVRTGEVTNTINTNSNASGRNTPMVCAFMDTENMDSGNNIDISLALQAGKNHVSAAYGMQVRRLTPVECARLQGFPDSHTRIPWRGKPAEDCPDGPQYKAYGNSMAVPCMAWLGRRISNHLKA